MILISLETITFINQEREEGRKNEIMNNLEALQPAGVVLPSSLVRWEMSAAKLFLRA